jgi:hypothetical protein
MTSPTRRQTHVIRLTALAAALALATGAHAETFYAPETNLERVDVDLLDSARHSIDPVSTSQGLVGEAGQ